MSFFSHPSAAAVRPSVFRAAVRPFGMVLVCLSALVTGTAVRADQQLVVSIVTHGQASDPFWNVVKRGAMEAAKELNVKMEYHAPETFDMIAMSRLIDAAVNQRVSGLVVTDPDPDALGPAIKRAIAAGIPVVSMNSGIQAAGRLGIALHVGQDELSAGRFAGAEMKRRGGTKVLCVNQEVGSVDLDRRCQGITQGFGGPVIILPTSTDPTEVAAKIRAALATDPSINFIIGLSAPLVGEPAVEVVQSLGLADKVKVATFDLSTHFLKDLSEGKAEFAVDQGAFLQGYLSVVVVTLKVRCGAMPVGNITSGPNLVTRENAAQLIALAAKGLR
ncbi:MAG TPA: sugar ABC transporter substrate-binding protein [Opitutaceae bacterium]|nr:sugar ABC transporter substrate-binding protein [Opitutaceae bacterium]